MSPRLDIHLADHLDVMTRWPDRTFDLIYVDPPFNTGRAQRREKLRTAKDADGDRTGFGGHRYRTEKLGSLAFADAFDDYLGWLEPRLREAHRLLTPTGSFFLHLDHREVHYAKVLCDQIFGRGSYRNHIVWAYDYGARSKSRWSPKHDDLLWYSRDPKAWTFDFDAIDRVPYMAPKLVGPEKARRGKTPTDVWWNTIVSPTGKERTGYPTQKPLKILERIVRVHSREGDRLLDFCAGSGSFGEAAAKHGRDCVLVDVNPEAVAVMVERLARFEPLVHGQIDL